MHPSSLAPARVVVALILVCGVVSSCGVSERIQSAVKTRSLSGSEEPVAPRVFHSSGLVCDGSRLDDVISDFDDDATGPATIELALERAWVGAPDVRAGLRERVVGSRVLYDYGDGDTKLIMRFVELNGGWLLEQKTQCAQG